MGAYWTRLSELVPDPPSANMNMGPVVAIRIGYALRRLASAAWQWRTHRSLACAEASAVALHLVAGLVEIGMFNC